MPLKLNVGVSRKIGLPDYGSIGASCHIEVELDQSLVFSDVDAFQQRARQVFGVCNQSVNDELARQQVGRGDHSAARSSENRPTANAGRNGQSGCNGSAKHRVSQKQLDYANQLASRIRGLGVRRLDTLAQNMFAKPLADLSMMDASGLIEALKQIKEGKIDLEAALNGAAP